MSVLLRTHRARFVVLMGLGAAAALVAPAGCLFPDYSFDLPEPSGGTGASGGGTNPTTGSHSEDCTNGVDDDNDGLADCADPKCVEVSCVPTVPTGWTGYVALYDGAPAGDPGCPSNFPGQAYVGTDGITAPAAVCQCSCSAPSWTPGCAALETITISTGDAPCADEAYCIGAVTVPPGWNGTCFNETGFSGGQLTCGPNTNQTCSMATGDPCSVSVRATAIAATGSGTCQPQLAPVNRPDPLWDRLGRACGDAPVTGAGCNIGQACMPRPEAPYESGLCISQEGNVACPPGAFTQKHVFYGSVEDTRGCADDCACGPGANGTCPATVSIYSDQTLGVCSTVVASFTAGTCMNVANNPAIRGRTVSAPGAPTGGSCTSTGGTPTGTAQPINPTTFCCIP
ncbi:hypothetical protein [Chondromyces crocatus]|uniref:Uncharacterized protein n=1 Tax=Chondromyces crocatus TaxID=52 RepID=A0A0K1EH03_CHOCO|nr:hypothetical protein [Chondromyces crocatus]AKT39878.1 uncharacterized protein CMC5_040290 [Chondromyces crocatus]